MLSFSSSARRRRLPPAPSLRSAARAGERKERRGAAEAGRGPRVRRQLLPDPRVSARRALPGPAWAAAAAAAGRGSGRGGGGRAAGAGPAVPALTCGARLLPTCFFPLGSWDSSPRRRPPSCRTRAPWVRRTRVPLSRKLFLRTRGGGGRKSGQRPLVCLRRSPRRVPALSSRPSFWEPLPGCRLGSRREERPAPGRAAGQGEGRGRVAVSED